MSTREAPRVGEVVLFRIHTTPEILRPLLVVSIVDGDTVGGEVFLDYERDRGYEWPRKLFYQLGKDSRTQWVSGVLPGSGVAAWRPLAGEGKAKVEKIAVVPVPTPGQSPRARFPQRRPQ